jgi:hypothetical protein
MNSVKVKILKEVVVVYFIVLSRYSPRETQENHEKLQAGKLVALRPPKSFSLRRYARSSGRK